jgi:DNA-binding beta-propeller fold protein YncE
MRSVAILLSVWLVACGSSETRTSAEPEPELVPTAEPVAEGAPRPIRPNAASFEGGGAWLNTSRPLAWSDLRGHVTVVDFFTSCCINCLQSFPTLQAIEERFGADGVVVVGVQSPKFPEERRADRLAAFLEQYGIEHPVVVDPDMRVWRAWGAEAWPTVFVIDAEGRVVWKGAGEPRLEELVSIVGGAVSEARANGTLVTTRVDGVGRGARPDRPLAFPGKVIALADGGLAIADSGNHRIVVLDRDRQVRLTVGKRGEVGSADGIVSRARFHFPQGLAEHNGKLYVADVENHSVRQIELATGETTTVAGTGRLGSGPLTFDWRAARSALRSPWDLAFVGDRLFVALAGSHQVGEIDLTDGRLRAFAGTGAERRIDGPRAEAAFAQPSGLAVDRGTLFVADSETSSVRAIDLAGETVRTVVGVDLFEFGDVDGDRRTARLQHPLGVAFLGGKLYVADTYNHAIRVVDAASGATTTLEGRATSGLDQPGGIAVQAGRLIVANTNAHELVTFDVRSGEREVIALDADRLRAAPAAPSRPDVPVVQLDLVRFDDVEVARSRPRIRVRFVTPAGTTLNPDAPLSVSWTSAEGLAAKPANVESTGRNALAGVEVPLTVTSGTERASLRGVVDLVVCDEETHRACVPWMRRIELRLSVVDGAVEVPNIALALPSARIAD